MPDNILLYTQNNVLSEQIKNYIDARFTLVSTDNLEDLNKYLQSNQIYLLVFDFLSNFEENQKIIENILGTYPFQLIILVIDREHGRDFLEMIENFNIYDIVSYPIYGYKFHFTVSRAVTYGKVMAKISDFKANEKQVFESMIKVFDWRKELDTRKVESIANELIHQINISFFHGSGLGSLISTLSILFAKSKHDAEKKSYQVHEKVYTLLKENYDEILKLSDSLSKTQAILAEKEHYSDTIVLKDFYVEIVNLVRGMRPVREIKNQNIILGDFPKDLADKSILCNIEKLKLIFEELLINAIKYSEDGDTIFILFSHDENSDLGIRILNPAYKNSDGTIGISDKNAHKIFEPIFRLQNVVDDRFLQETFRFGLGLTVVNKIVDLHRGSISFYTLDNNIRRENHIKDVCVWLRFPII